jgi:phage protein D
MTTQSPTFKPARPSLAIDGQDDASLAAELVRLSIHEHVDGLYRCEATFGNWGAVSGGIGFLYFDRKKLEYGKTLRVKLADDVLFEGRIFALEGRFPEGQPAEITALAEDKMQDLRMTRRTRTFANVTDSDVFSQIAGDHGLTPSVDVSGPSHPVLAQANQSDLAFVRERARAVEAELWIDGSALHVQARARRGSASGPVEKLSYRSDLREFTVIADLSGQRSAVTVSGWDVASKDALSYEATDSVISSELGGDASGASILAAKIAQRKEAIVHTAPRTSAEAQAQAEAYFKMTARRFVVGHGVAETAGRVRVGRLFDISGLGPLFSGKYYLTEVRHLFDGAAGIRTEFTAERPGLGQGS